MRKLTYKLCNAIIYSCQWPGKAELSMPVCKRSDATTILHVHDCCVMQTVIQLLHIFLTVIFNYDFEPPMYVSFCSEGYAVVAIVYKYIKKYQRFNINMANVSGSLTITCISENMRTVNKLSVEAIFSLFLQLLWIVNVNGAYYRRLTR